MPTRRLWYVFDVGLGLLVAGIVLPLAVVLLPAHLRGKKLMAAVCIGSVALASFLRRRLSGAGGDRRRGR
jgi:hypothetical protein